MRQILILAMLAMQALPAHSQGVDETIEELVVTTQRREQPRLMHAGNIERLDEKTIDRAKHQHIHELLTRVAGVWITRASGQEHLTAIRSPVLTGAGSCGAFLFLEDGVPIRPAGFCNVNSLFEAATELAQSVEVIRGPGNALYGSNALHGTINVLLPEVDTHRPRLALEAGANDYTRVRASVPFAGERDWLTSVVLTDDGGFRDDSGYRQAKLHAKWRSELRGGRLLLGMTATNLDQETAGFILGEDAYKDSTMNRQNLNPEAFRKASSIRMQGRWERAFDAFDADLRPFLRYSDMEFLQHFLPGQPLEENGHVSGGILATARFSGDHRSTIIGVDVEWADMFLKETQDGPTEGSPFLVETRPEGKHYDYDVTSIGIAAYVQSDWQPNDRLIVGAGLRAELIHYDYDNRMLTGNTRDDGTACGFGGCLYTRPADRGDRFANLAPKLSLSYRLGEQSSVYASIARGFRAPQATELYRLQSGQEIADLDSERIDSIEIGWRTSRDNLTSDIGLFSSRKRGSIYRDAEGFNVSGARSKHRGIEAAIDLGMGSAWVLSIDASYARHTYDFDAVAARGETFVSGREVDTAPRLLGSVELLFDPGARIDLALQWTRLGSYYLDAENRFRYPGHSIANLRAGIELTENFDLVLRLNNMTDRAIADRADYAFGNFRYFPGRGRELFAEISYSP
ncbi:MAG: TonB-dependent receptor [Woeseiaceae bacterium]|nr:TonB-dependent receptor [Woeseiaceae bacterium]